MKTSTKLLFAVTLLLLLFMTGCDLLTSNKHDKTVIPDNPDAITSAQADWLLELTNYDYYGPGEATYPFLRVTLKYLINPQHVFTASDQAILYVDDEPYTLAYNQGTDYNLFEYEQGLMINDNDSHSLVFKLNGVVKVRTDFRLPYRASVSFPETYESDSPAPVSWTLDGNNQFQYISLSSSDVEQTGNSTVDSMTEQLDTAARSFTFPANAVEPAHNSIGQTRYWMDMRQVNCKIVDRVAVKATLGGTIGYTCYQDESIPYEPEMVSPDYAQWLLNFEVDSRNNSRAYTEITAKCLYSGCYPAETDSVTIDVGGQHIRLEMIDGTQSFYALADLPLGEALPLIFRVNDHNELHYESYVRLPNVAAVQFPADFDISQPTAVQWTLSDCNEYQFLKLKAFKLDGSAEGLSSTSLVRLDGSVRDYTFAAFAVQDLGPGTEYTLSLQQQNYQVVEQVVIMCTQIDGRYYYQ